jgi:hypothetical protein
MTKLLICTTMLIGIQSARAEDAPATPETATAAEQTAPKSFFEERTLEDVQQMVKIDQSLIDGSSDMSSTSGS